MVNSPLPVDDFGVLNAPDNVPQEPPREVKELAKAASSNDGQYILNHLQKQVDNHVAMLKTTDFSGVPPELTAANVMGWQMVIQIMEDVIGGSQRAIDTVKDAATN